MTERSKRPRRLRASRAIRAMSREARVHPAQLILPLFLVEGDDAREPIDALPGVDRLSIDAASGVIDRAMSHGILGFALFPRIDKSQKTVDGSSALRDDSLACRAIQTLSRRFPEAAFIADVALDPYSSFGHDGIVRDGRVINDETVDVLAAMAVLMAEAGAAIVAPSDMMDGRVGAVRSALERAGLHDTVIMSYAAKYASAFYGPFREALGSMPVVADGVPSNKRTYQMDPANADEAIREAALDLEEGADILLVKPGLPYLDVVRTLATTFEAPVAAYHVSGEYAMLRAAADRGLIDFRHALVESLTCLVRAGARQVLTYAAIEAAAFLQSEGVDD